MYKTPAVTARAVRSITYNGCKSSRPFIGQNGLQNPYSTASTWQACHQQRNTACSPFRIEQQKRYSSIGDTLSSPQGKQTKTPWHREGSDVPPVERPRQAGAMTKGKLLTTPSRLLKLILPLTTSDQNHDRKDIEPLALLVHPQQPLSYLERLIQSELPPLPNQKIPYVHFRAEDSQQETIEPKAPGEKKDETAEDMYDEKVEDTPGKEEVSIGGQRQKTGKISSKSDTDSSVPPAEPRTESSPSKKDGSSSPPPGPLSDSEPTTSSSSSNPHLIRWSPSTEIGDFIRDAAQAKEFAVEIEGQGAQILVGVPSFNDRTHFLRQRLRATAGKIRDLNDIKKECDEAAHQSAQHYALFGGGLLATYWGGVYYLTFQTDYGWDVMEPVTYLIGLSCIISGYLWFLWHNREVSYRAAMNLTVSRRRAKLYEDKGFDFSRWEGLLEEANHYRNEVKAIAREYDVEWDELKDEKSEGVAKAMRKMRKEGEKRGGKGGRDDDD